MVDSRPKLKLRIVDNEKFEEIIASTSSLEINCQTEETGREECRTPSPLINSLPASPAKKPTERSIKPALSKFGFPEDIVNRAETIYHLMNVGTHRAKKLTQLHFFCLHNAYKELGIPHDPKKIAEKLGMSNSEKQKAISAFSEVQTGYRPLQIKSTPLDVIPGFCRDLELSDEIKDNIITFATELIDKHPLLLEKYPQTAAAGIVKYYLYLSQITVDNNLFANVVKMSAATVNTTYKAIMRLDCS